MFACFWALFFVAFAAWSWATPLFGAPDEAAQEIKAVAVVRGEWTGSNIGGPSDPYVGVTVPRAYAAPSSSWSCLTSTEKVPASCAESPAGGSSPTRVETYVGRYPPLYYALVGLPSLATASATGIYLMRLVSAFLSALFLALAATSVVLWSRSAVILAGLVLAATPTLFFLGGVINPSGFEVSAAACLWCSALVLVLERSKDAPLGLVAIVALSASAMVLSRGLSPLWLALIALCLLVLAPKRFVSLLQHRRCRAAAAAITGCTVLATVWIVTMHSLDVVPSLLFAPKGISDAGILEDVFGETPRFLTQTIGMFGILTTPSPLYTYVIWYVGVGMVAGAAVIMARYRQLAVLLGVTVAAIVVPVLISASDVRKNGFIWQGKDGLPLAIGIPLVAAAILGRSLAIRRRSSRLVAVVVAAIAIAQFVAFVQALRRNVTGLPGPLNYLNGPWQPPLGALLVTVVAFAVWLSLAVVIWQSALRMDSGDLAAEST